MCWNARVSWITFIIGTLANIIFALLVPIYYRLWFVFFQFIITVQLGEAFIWGETYAKLGSYIAFFSVWLQPFMLCILLNYYDISPRLIYLQYILLVLYSVLSIPNLKTLSENIKYPVQCGSSRHINFKTWDNNEGMAILYLTTTLLSVIFLFPEFYVIGAFLILTLIISLVFYSKVFASLWCWFAVFSPIVYYSGLRLTKKI